MATLEHLEHAFTIDRALVFGIGGSGDIVGSIPTARLLELHDVDVTLGGVAWEPVPYDSKPGPRHFDELVHLQRVNDTVGIVSPQTKTKDGIEFTETRVARHYDEDVLLLALHRGAEGLYSGLQAACEAFDFDLVIGVDAGGDAIAQGSEPGLRSPVTDGLGIVALSELSVPTALGVFGYGSDGELTLDELEAAIGRIARRDGLLGAWGITRRIRGELAELLEVVDTEASRLPVEAAEGRLGSRTIRGGDVSLNLTPPSTVTFYFEPTAVEAESRLASHVRGTESLDEATTALDDAGYPIEFDIERRRLERLE